ncbi:unnamed protein product [Echinostoma caproni]|uniref:Uncharacterized protein n=1 Tax=Echinostoma caproni TaxID=27848 RepID=A0A3P8IJZ6_9TREM|nr:unnamed protein product [Echinostoma caproni]
MWNPDTFIAAEYSQEVFVEPHLEILLSAPNYNRYRRQAPRIMANESIVQSIQSDSPAVPAPDVLVYGRQLIKDQDYKIIAVAKSYGTKNIGNPSPLPPPSRHDLRFDSLIEANETGAKQDSCAGVTEPKARPRVNQPVGGGTGGTSGTDMFTVSLIAVIVGLGIIAIVCIAVGCVMR